MIFLYTYLLGVLATLCVIFAAMLTDPYNRYDPYTFKNYMIALGYAAVFPITFILVIREICKNGHL